MINQYILCMLFSVLLASVSQVLLKKSTLCKYKSVIEEYINPYVIGGYGLLFLSMLLTIYAYSGMDYKNGPIIEAFGNVIVLGLSFVFFNEKISLKKIVGIICIISGIAIFYLP